MSDLTLDAVTVRRNGRPVLDAVTTAFPGGRRTVLWGPSGAGKSTLLAAIAGLVEPGAGTIRLGREVLFSRGEGISVVPHLRRVGFVFQDLALWPHLRALEQVRLVARSAGARHATDVARVLLESVGLADLAHRRPAELSGGEQQRLALARAVAGQPEILLLDEPFSSVDGATRGTLRALLRDLSPRVPGPTIYVTHDPGDVRELAEEVVELAGGKLVPRRGPDELGI